MTKERGADVSSSWHTFAGVGPMWVWLPRRLHQIWSHCNLFRTVGEHLCSCTTVAFKLILQPCCRGQLIRRTFCRDDAWGAEIWSMRMITWGIFLCIWVENRENCRLCYNKGDLGPCCWGAFQMLHKPFLEKSPSSQTPPRAQLGVSSSWLRALSSAQWTWDKECHVCAVSLCPLPLRLRSVWIKYNSFVLISSSFTDCPYSYWTMLWYLVCTWSGY